MSKMMLHPTKVKVDPDRIRQTFNPKEMEELKSSLLYIGQKQPILITRDNTLVVGERRTRACLDLNMEVWAVYEDEADPLLLLEIELAENLYRSGLTPTEVVLAKDRLRELREEQQRPSTTRELASELGESKTQTAEDLRLAAFVKAAPQLFEKCKTKADLKRVVKGLEQKIQWSNLQKAADNLGTKPKPGPKPKIDQSPEDRRKAFIESKIVEYNERLLIGDAFAQLPKLRDVQIMLLDPPWGVDHHEKQELGVHVDSGYEDRKEEFYDRFPKLCKLCYKAMHQDSHLYCFFGIVHHDFVYESLEGAGFMVNRRPIIICKKESTGIPKASTRVPDIWPGAGYEPVAFARKGNRKLARRGIADWAGYKWPTPKQKKSHPNAKPPSAYIDLLRRSGYPGDLVCDPMYGSGAAFVACELLHDLKLRWTGWERDKTFKNIALVNLTEMMMKGGQTDG